MHAMGGGGVTVKMRLATLMWTTSLLNLAGMMRFAMFVVPGASVERHCWGA